MSRSLDVNWDRRWQQESEGEITAEEEASAAAAAAVASNTCIAAVAVLTETLHHCTGEDNTNILRYVPFSSDVLGDTFAAMMSGVRTYPAYAHRGDGAGGGGGGDGVVCAGTYATIPHPRVFPASRRIPTVDLLVSYRYQTDHAAATQKSPQDACARRLVELMRLDAWLSLVGRMAEIEGEGEEGGDGDGGRASARFLV
ncbi:hypothetical protein UCREL1_11762 [Eutypa lata UCREL1]|uniref:Uncharacterized protein n=1 Tax=Eutypa lata (strain UCR-EL1) TaxID=1287681 RepID=M7SAX5_EUTLA|nr:hypothetical protein UCREL1_11762 [Eutypa lata UCREL1]